MPALTVRIRESSLVQNLARGKLRTDAHQVVVRPVLPLAVQVELAAAFDQGGFQNLVLRRDRVALEDVGRPCSTASSVPTRCAKSLG
jgi:hypothetical protein